MVAALAALAAIVLLPTLLVTRAASTSPSSRRVIAADDAALPDVYEYEVVRVLPHDPHAFTQGLQYDLRDGREIFWESTGLYGLSEVREVDLVTGEVLRSVRLPAQYFGEGLTRYGSRLLQLTWRQGTLLEYESTESFHEADVVGFTNKVRARGTGLADGWGLTTDGASLIVTDSSPQLYWLDPDTLAMQRNLTIMDGTHPVPWVNELEWVNGKVWGNIWQTPCVAVIDPLSARVSGWIVLTGLSERTRAAGVQQGVQMDVLNGIAFNEANGRLYVTGKNWGQLYEISVRKVEDVSAESVLKVRSRCIPRVRGQQ